MSYTFRLTENEAAKIISSKRQGVIVKLSCFEIELVESVDCIKKYGFVESGINKWKRGFTEIRKLGGWRYTIRHDMNPYYHVTNIENMEVYVKNFIRM